MFRSAYSVCGCQPESKSLCRAVESPIKKFILNQSLSGQTHAVSCRESKFPTKIKKSIPILRAALPILDLET